MRCLLLLRHGKAASPDGIDDADRPLTGRGGDASRRMGLYLAEQGLVPDLALVSPARRAQETWSLAEPALAGVPARSDARIYEAPPDRLLAVVREAPEIGTLLVVGHNPGLEELLRMLLSREERYATAATVAKFPTAALAAVDLAAPTWRAVAPGSGSLHRFVTPKSLGWSEDD
jgi:phosphohistidine phosphatase